MKILKYMAENVKRLKVVEIEPDGNLVIIGGKNDSGKSSALDAIAMALGGKKHEPDEPIRRGAKSAKVRLELGESIQIGPEIVVKLVLTRSGERHLVVENSNGRAFKSPQAMLDGLFNALTFDPLEFERQDDKVQAETLRELVGLDLSTIDEKRKAAYDERTSVNRDVKQLQMDVDSLPRHHGVPEKEISIAAITENLAKAETLQRTADAKRRALMLEENRAATLTKQKNDWEKEITQLERELSSAREGLQKAEARIEEHADVYALAKKESEDAAADVPDTSEIRATLAESEKVNIKVRENKKRTDAIVWLDKKKAEAERLTDRIRDLDDERKQKIAAAKFPVEGLGFDEGGMVTYRDLPFSQASSSQRTMVSMSIAIAKNPKLRVALVRDGSLIGTERLKEIAAIAEQTDSQVWIEMMQDSPNDRTTVFIEDGAVASVTANT